MKALYIKQQGIPTGEAAFEGGTTHQTIFLNVIHFMCVYIFVSDRTFMWITMARCHLVYSVTLKLYL